MLHNFSTLVIGNLSSLAAHFSIVLAAQYSNSKSKMLLMIMMTDHQSPPDEDLVRARAEPKPSNKKMKMPFEKSFYLLHLKVKRNLCNSS